MVVLCCCCVVCGGTGVGTGGAVVGGIGAIRRGRNICVDSGVGLNGGTGSLGRKLVVAKFAGGNGGGAPKIEVAAGGTGLG